MRKDDARVAKAFSGVLRERRLAAGLTQEALAHEADLERTYISFLERGLRQPSLRVLIAIAEALNVAPSELVRQLEGRLKSK
jgi:XRE family transcriptional regulator, regulator of sulfur utilization